MPTRDVDVTYAMLVPDGQAGSRVLNERMRWGVGAGKLRVDPPTPGLYMVMDMKARRIVTIRETDRLVLEIDGAAANVVVPGAVSGASFTRRGDATVAGFACTEWETQAASGEAALVCLTTDGVMLRAASAGRTLIEASKVVYAPVDIEAFRIPDGYRHVTRSSDDRTSQ